MPRPPVLQTIEWKSVFESGKDYDAWLEAAESRDNADKMRARHAAVDLTAQAKGFLAALTRPVFIVAIAEDWCGDVIRHVPVLRRIEEAAPRLSVRFISREQHPNVFVRFLTNGGEAIPKFIFLSDKFVECGNWGPMPAACREWIARGKASGDVGAARKKVALLYEADASGAEVARELLHLIDIAASPAP